MDLNVTLIKKKVKRRGYRIEYKIVLSKHGIAIES